MEPLTLLFLGLSTSYSCSVLENVQRRSCRRCDVATIALEGERIRSTVPRLGSRLSHTCFPNKLQLVKTENTLDNMASQNRINTWKR